MTVASLGPGRLINGCPKCRWGRVGEEGLLIWIREKGDVCAAETNKGLNYRIYKLTDRDEES